MLGSSLLAIRLFSLPAGCGLEIIAAGSFIERDVTTGEVVKLSRLSSAGIVAGLIRGPMIEVIGAVVLGLVASAVALIVTPPAISLILEWLMPAFVVTRRL